MEDGIPARADGCKEGRIHEHKAGRVDGTLKTARREVCAHQRLVDEQINIQGEKTGHLVCRECGEVIHKPVEA
ncbi:hypothetical protein [Candidatus Nitrospira neomarina]|uniref:Uncharacterized protein n=1 Tax=Candidatus Nitrospira neomarina TaxID=3020899 RepID=A0AA96JVW3_9BACT|nr:hypothetical protein [Candidatus Nitrospira neomarina]WNM62217.1 hypothetical protein PQG83_00295 [Candidatus Nitrospira neomarina]